MKYTLFFTLVILFVSCVSVTPYMERRTGKEYGYSDIKLDDNVFQIYFKGNYRTGMERVNDFALLRAAEVTLKNGCDYFAILDGNQYVKEYINSYNFSMISSAEIVRKPGMILKIRCFKEKPDVFAYNAKNIVKNISKKYGLKKLETKYRIRNNSYRLNNKSKVYKDKKKYKKRMLNPASPYQNQEEKEIFTVVEEMPVFPGCENESSISKRNECTTKRLNEYINENLKYPEDAKAKGVKGRVVVRFVITKTGEIENVKILKDIGGGCGEAAKKAIESMNNMPEKWIPGRQGGRDVNVFYTIPVIFRISKKESNKMRKI